MGVWVYDGFEVKGRCECEYATQHHNVRDVLFEAGQTTKATFGVHTFVMFYAIISSQAITLNMQRDRDEHIKL